MLQLQTVQIVTGPGYRVVVSPGVRHLPELLSVTERKVTHGNMRTTVIGVREIFRLPVILTIINLIKQIKFLKNG